MDSVAYVLTENEEGIFITLKEVDVSSDKERWYETTGKETSSLHKNATACKKKAIDASGYAPRRNIFQVGVL